MHTRKSWRPSPSSAEQRPGADGLQRPLRSRFQPQLRPGVGVLQHMDQELQEFYEAIEDDNLDTVRRRLDRSPHLANAPWDHYGITPLMRAVSKEERNPACVQLLLSAGADVNAKTQEGYTALHMFTEIYYQAEKAKTYVIAQLLKEAGADVEATQHWDWTPLMMAAIEGQEDEFRALLAIGCNPYVTYTERSLPVFTRGQSLLQVVLGRPQKVVALADYSYRFDATILERGTQSIREALEQPLPPPSPVLVRFLAGRGETYEAWQQQATRTFVAAVQESLHFIQGWLASQGC